MEQFCSVFSPAQFNSAVIPISLVSFCSISFSRPQYTQSVLPVAIVSQFSPILRIISNILRLVAGISQKSCRHFPSPISALAKIPSNPAFPDETPASPLQSTSNPTTLIPDVAPSLTNGLQLATSLLENNHPVTAQELPPFNSILIDVRPFFHPPLTSKFSPITLLLDVKISVSTTLTAHEK